MKTIIMCLLTSHLALAHTLDYDAQFCTDLFEHPRTWQLPAQSDIRKFNEWFGKFYFCAESERARMETTMLERFKADDPAGDDTPKLLTMLRAKGFTFTRGFLQSMIPRLTGAVALKMRSFPTPIHADTAALLSDASSSCRVDCGTLDEDPGLQELCTLRNNMIVMLASKNYRSESLK
jgi:hypothetical protein